MPLATKVDVSAALTSSDPRATPHDARATWSVGRSTLLADIRLSALVQVRDARGPVCTQANSRPLVRTAVAVARLGATRIRAGLGATFDVLPLDLNAHAIGATAEHQPAACEESNSELKRAQRVPAEHCRVDAVQWTRDPHACHGPSGRPQVFTCGLCHAQEVRHCPPASAPLRGDRLPDWLPNRTA